LHTHVLGQVGERLLHLVDRVRSVDDRRAASAREDLDLLLGQRGRVADGVETGKFEIPAGGRRFQALSLLVKQKRLAKTAPVPCVLRDVTSDILSDSDIEYLQELASGALISFP
jgi:ParB family chromosome partitioning protein